MAISLYNEQSSFDDIADSLIYDRTQADVDYALSLESNSIYTVDDLRGAYNVSDRNRVGIAINRLIEAMKLFGFHAKDNWNEYDIAKVADNANTLACLTRLQQLLKNGATTDIPSDLESLTYQKANAVERVLYEVYSVYSWIADSVMYAGDGYASDFDAPSHQIFDDYWKS